MKYYIPTRLKTIYKIEYLIKLKNHKEILKTVNHTNLTAVQLMSDFPKNRKVAETIKVFQQTELI